MRRRELLIGAAALGLTWPLGVCVAGPLPAVPGAAAGAGGEDVRLAGLLERHAQDLRAEEGGPDRLADYSLAARTRHRQATVQRLAIDHERLLAYLTGFQGQIGAAGAQVEALLASGEPVQARQQLERLHLGCRTLGLHGAAEAMAALLQAAVLDGAQLPLVLALLARSAAQQAHLLRQQDGAAG